MHTYSGIRLLPQCMQCGWVFACVCLAQRQTMNNNIVIKWWTHARRDFREVKIHTIIKKTAFFTHHGKHYLMGNNKLNWRVFRAPINTSVAATTPGIECSAHSIVNESGEIPFFYGILITTLINFIDFWLETIFFFFHFLPFVFLRDLGFLRHTFFIII